MARWFLDTEFIEDGKTIDLISIGIVNEAWTGEKDRVYYAINDECDFRRANEWVRQNVIPLLPERHSEEGRMLYKPRKMIRREILEFLGNDEKPEFWAHYADYDWVAFCQLFGRMVDLPPNFPMLCMDLKQWMIQLKFPNDRLPLQENEHNALDDARWNRELWSALENYQWERDRLEEDEDS